jgi:hypothetical protein
MNARPVTHAGSERPERKKSMLDETRDLAMNPIPMTNTKVDRDQRVVDELGVETQRGLRVEGHR